tara:strand:+ start:1153 stop:2001 length:849 start_codon:yes stop_codon:yes gene_type:complete
MDTSREDFGIAVRSAFLSKGTKQKFSLFILVIFSIILIFLETIELKPLKYFRSFIKDTIYRSSLIISIPSESFGHISNSFKEHINLHKNYGQLKQENEVLKDSVTRLDYLELENTQLREIIDDRMESPSYLLSARVMLDKQSPYLNSFIINMGLNKDIKKGMAVLDGKNFIGRIVDVNFFSSRVLLVSDLNSKIPIITEPSGYHGILGGHGNNEPSLEYLPENNSVVDGDKVFTSGKEGIFFPGMPIGKVKIVNNEIKVSLFSDLSQVNFVNIDIGNFEGNK